MPDTRLILSLSFLIGLRNFLELLGIAMTTWQLSSFSIAVSEIDLGVDMSLQR